jgi:ribonuclease HI
MSAAADDVVATLRDLEESLWREETSYDRAYMEAILAPGFVEFGMSGRRYDRDDILAAEVGPIGARLPLEDFTVILVRPDVAVVTYVSEDVADGPRRANRMSLWDRAGGRWQLLFHQGTAVPAGHAAQ